jgi:glycosyltransferase involved in cell wall biosynthesis
MKSPLASVIIPVYNGADYLGETIESVLDQTYSHFELIIVDDASTDDSHEVISGFKDERITNICHEQNLGANPARKTGILASSGEVIAFLDQDDFYHPEKLKAHVDYLVEHPDVGLTYNSRIELNYSSKTIREIWRPPEKITLADLVLGIPIAPSDMVATRKWGLRMDLSKESAYFGGEIGLLGKLYLDGCKFAFVNRALNSKRHHTGRVISNLEQPCSSYLSSLDNVFSDPRCPAEVKALRNFAFANSYVVWSYEAFAQNETDLGQSFLHEAIRLKPSVLEGSPCELIQFLAQESIADENRNHAELIKNLLAQLPPEMAWLSNQCDWAVGHGYLLRGARAIMWDRFDDGRRFFARATESGAQIDELFLQKLTHQLLAYETEFGDDAAMNMIHKLAPYVEKAGNRSTVRSLRGCYLVNKAFRNYRIGKYENVPGEVFQAVANRPKYLLNRGVFSIFLRSLAKQNLMRIEECLV